MTYKIRKANKPHTCRFCQEDIESTSVYVDFLMPYTSNEGKFSVYNVRYHPYCFCKRLLGQVRVKRDEVSQRPLKPIKETQKFRFSDVDNELVVRRRRLLQYLNRDRWKLEGYYYKGDDYNIERSYSKIASRIDELIEIGLEFKLNELGQLVQENDRTLAENLASTTSWVKRAELFREREYQSVVV